MMAMTHAPAKRRRAAPEPRTVEPSHRPATVSREDRRVQIAAAKARVSVDKLTGDETPEWIIALSMEQPE
jgi:hypothetical protein